MNLQTVHIQPLSDSFTADQVIGNRVKTKKAVTVFEGYPNSDRTRYWPAGKLSPIVDTYIQKDGAVWWSFGEETPILYLKHDSKALELIPDVGASHLQKEDSAKNPFGLGFDLEGIQEYAKKAAVIGGVGLGLYLFMPLIRTGIKAAATSIAERNELQ